VQCSTVQCSRTHSVQRKQERKKRTGHSDAPHISYPATRHYWTILDCTYAELRHTEVQSIPYVVGVVPPLSLHLHLHLYLYLYLALLLHLPFFILLFLDLPSFIHPIHVIRPTTRSPTTEIYKMSDHEGHREEMVDADTFHNHRHYHQNSDSFEFGIPRPRRPALSGDFTSSEWPAPSIPDTPADSRSATPTSVSFAPVFFAPRNVELTGLFLRIVSA
jgi:hypothetical protein